MATSFANVVGGSVLPNIVVVDVGSIPLDAIATLVDLRVAVNKGKSS